jgi:hypothetical protein
MTPDFRRRWANALRSGEYKQTRGSLHKNGAFCCLGVACVVAGAAPDILAQNATGCFDLDERFQIDTGISSDDVGDFVDLNDRAGLTFSQIADEVENDTFRYTAEAFRREAEEGDDG